jgi:hypothetical protein
MIELKKVCSLCNNSEEIWPITAARGRRGAITDTLPSTRSLRHPSEPNSENVKKEAVHFWERSE